MLKSRGQCVSLMTYRFILTNCRRGMIYRRGVRIHARILLGATYENKASFFTMEIVFTANTNWCSSFAFETILRNWPMLACIYYNRWNLRTELVSTVIIMVIIRKWQTKRNRIK